MALKHEELRGIDTVFFDMGGVLAPDIWEGLMFKHGLAQGSNWTEPTMAAHISGIWKRYSTMLDGQESDFWGEVSESTGLVIDDSCLQEARKLLSANADADRTFEFLKNQGKRIGIISDNTNFFYPQQVGLLGGAIENYTDPTLRFLSHQAGVGKKDGLLEIVASHVNPENALLVDDRQPNLDRAEQLGFVGLKYHIDAPLAEIFGNN